MQSHVWERQTEKYGSVRTQRFVAFHKNALTVIPSSSNRRNLPHGDGRKPCKPHPALYYAKALQIPGNLQMISPSPPKHLLQTPTIASQDCNSKRDENKTAPTFHLGVIFSYDLLILFEFCWRRHVFCSKKINLRIDPPEHGYKDNFAPLNETPWFSVCPSPPPRKGKKKKNISPWREGVRRSTAAAKCRCSELSAWKRQQFCLPAPKPLAAASE